MKKVLILTLFALMNMGYSAEEDFESILERMPDREFETMLDKVDSIFETLPKYLKTKKTHDFLITTTPEYKAFSSGCSGKCQIKKD